jgi:hypothetical protein
MNRNLVVMIPVFNDWESSYMLFRRLNEVLSLRQVPAALIIIDDGSDQTFDPDQFDLSGGSGIDSIVVLRLNRNLDIKRRLRLALPILTIKMFQEVCSLWMVMAKTIQTMLRCCFAVRKKILVRSYLRKEHNGLSH